MSYPGHPRFFNIEFLEDANFYVNTPIILSFPTVPVSPLSQYQADYSSEMLIRIIHDCGAAFVLTSKEFSNHKSITELLKSSPVPWHCEVDTEILPEEVSDNEAAKLLDMAKPEDIPFLQYTSGSMGTYTCMTVFAYGIPLFTCVTSAV